MISDNGLLSSCYSIISQCQRAAVLGQYGDLTVDQFKDKVTEQVKSVFSDFNPAPYLMISEQNDQVAEWINEAVRRYNLWLTDWRPTAK